MPIRREQLEFRPQLRWNNSRHWWPKGVPMERKRCGWCGEEKDMTEFATRGSGRAYNQRRGICVKCDSRKRQQRRR